MENFSWIPWLIAGISLLYTVSRNFNGDIGQNVIKANIKLDSICATQSEIRNDVRAISNRLNDAEKEIAMMQRDLKTAYSRIERLECKETEQ